MEDDISDKADLTISKNTLLLKNNETNKKSVEIFSEPWKLNKGLQQSGEYLFKKNGWIFIRTALFFLSF